MSAVGLSDSDVIHITGISAYSSTIRIAIDQRTFSRAVVLHLRLPPLRAVEAPKPFTNRTAIRITQRKISTDTAEPRPRFTRLIRTL